MTDYNEDKSRTEIKKEANELQKLGERLISLTNEQLSFIDIPDELKNAVKNARTITAHKAKRRQHQFIGSLMRQIDPEPIFTALQMIESGLSLKGHKLKHVKQWQESILAGDDTIIETIISNHPEVEHQRLRQLIRNARKKQSDPKKKKAATSLFKYLKEISG